MRHVETMCPESILHYGSERQKQRDERAYSIWEAEGRPNGEEDRVCPHCSKSFKIKEWHRLLAWHQILHEEYIDRMGLIAVPKEFDFTKAICEWYH